MKIGNALVVIVIGYFVIGGLIALTQLGLTKLFEPPCNGTIVHTLWADFPKQISDSDALEGKKDPPLTHYFYGLGRGLAQWLPDLYQEVIAGDMAVRDYLLGGYKCVAASPFYWPKSITPLPESMKGGSVADLLKKEANKDAERAADQTLVTIEPIAGVTLELPGDWRVVDQTAIQQQMTERNQTWGIPEVPQLHGFVPPGQVENVSIEVSSLPPILPGKELQNLHDPEVRKFVDGMIKGFKEELEKKGFTAMVSTDPSEERGENWTGFGFSFQMVSPSGANLESRHTVIQTPKRTIVLNLANSKGSPSKFGETLKHARESLKITSQ